MKKRDKKGRFKIIYKELKNKKKCSVCLKNLPIENFQFLNKNNPNGVHKIGTRSSRCKNCFNFYRKKSELDGFHHRLNCHILSHENSFLEVVQLKLIQHIQHHQLQ